MFSTFLCRAGVVQGQSQPHHVACVGMASSPVTALGPATYDMLAYRRKCEVGVARGDGGGSGGRWSVAVVGWVAVVGDLAWADLWGIRAVGGVE